MREQEGYRESQGKIRKLEHELFKQKEEMYLQNLQCCVQRFRVKVLELVHDLEFLYLIGIPTAPPNNSL